MLGHLGVRWLATLPYGALLVFWDRTVNPHSVVVRALQEVQVFAIEVS